MLFDCDDIGVDGNASKTDGLDLRLDWQVGHFEIPFAVIQVLHC
jgi:hypothetical protein